MIYLNHMVKNNEDTDTRFLVAEITDENRDELGKMRPGSIKIFDTPIGDVVFRKQTDGSWVPADGDDDIFHLTYNEKGDIIPSMSDTKTKKKHNDLIPNSDKLFAEGYNLLL